jgi:hypothetical protein
MIKHELKKTEIVDWNKEVNERYERGINNNIEILKKSN